MSEESPNITGIESTSPEKVEDKNSIDCVDCVLPIESREAETNLEKVNDSDISLSEQQHNGDEKVDTVESVYDVLKSKSQEEETNKLVEINEASNSIESVYDVLKSKSQEEEEPNKSAEVNASSKSIQSVYDALKSKSQEDETNSEPVNEGLDLPSTEQQHNTGQDDDTEVGREPKVVENSPIIPTQVEEGGESKSEESSVTDISTQVEPTRQIAAGIIRIMQRKENAEMKPKHGLVSCDDQRNRLEMRINYGHKRSRDWSIFEWTTERDRKNSKTILQWLVEKAERKANETTGTLLNATNRPNSKIDLCSVFGPQNKLFRLMENEIQYLHNNGRHTLAWMVALWSSQLIPVALDAKARMKKCDVIDNLLLYYDSQNGDKNSLYGDVPAYTDCPPLLALAEDAIQDSHYHLAVTYKLYLRSLSETKEAIELLLKHQFYRDAAILSRYRLPPTDPLFIRVFDNWAHVQIERGKPDEAAKCFMLIGQYEEAVKALASSSNSTLPMLLLACRIGRLVLTRQEPIRVEDAEKMRIGGVLLRIDQQKEEMVRKLAIKTLLTALSLFDWEKADAIAFVMDLPREWKAFIVVYQTFTCKFLNEFSALARNSHDNPFFFDYLLFPQSITDMVGSEKPLLKSLYDNLVKDYFNDDDPLQIIKAVVENLKQHYERLEGSLSAKDTDPGQFAVLMTFRLMLGILYASVDEIEPATEYFQKAVHLFNESFATGITDILKAVSVLGNSDDASEIDKRMAKAVGFLEKELSSKESTDIVDHIESKDDVVVGNALITAQNILTDAVADIGSQSTETDP